jgi:hypothetical protein
MLKEQIAESVQSYFEIILKLPQIPDIRTKEYAEACQQLVRIRAEIKFLEKEIARHCPEHSCIPQSPSANTKEAEIALNAPAPVTRFPPQNERFHHQHESWYGQARPRTN